MGHFINMQYVANSVVFSGLGMVMLIFAFFLIDLLTPHYHLWREIVEKQNMALAILMGAFCIGIALIVASAIHG